MTLDSVISRRLFGIFLLGFILFDYPILSIFNLETFLFGIPLLYLYLLIRLDAVNTPDRLCHACHALS